MSRPSDVGENPNDKLPDGNPLKPGEVVSDDDASSAGMEQEVDEDLEDLDNEDDGLGPADEDEEQPGLPR